MQCNFKALGVHVDPQSKVYRSMCKMCIKLLFRLSKVRLTNQSQITRGVGALFLSPSVFEAFLRDGKVKDESR